MNAWTPVRDENKEILGYFKEEKEAKEGVWSKARRLAKEHYHTRTVTYFQIVLVLWR